MTILSADSQIVLQPARQTHHRESSVKAGKPRPLARNYEVHSVDPKQHERSVRQLVERRYAWRGLPASSEHCSPVHSLTLAASCGEEVFGTATLGLDGPGGLHADQLYSHELTRLRGPGVRLCEITRLAVDTPHNTLEVLGTLFHLAYIHGRLIRGATDLVIEVHPRHVGFYQRMLGFVQLGEEKPCPRVDNAPAVLLHLDLRHVDRQIAQLGGAPSCRARSLYTYFLSRDEQENVLNACGRARPAGLDKLPARSGQLG
ncbi:long-chain N-acyl amino acid synthase [Zoogloea sp.]|uniref:N-acyl amino acid synthase FeeM domain-containing protein n=1 Tax=Zoogloea sp. TaxID=49181 RepID=UPI0014160277|nr:MAG: long-chain N-acyl amino acid synthase [Zoogloea sp.]